MTETEICKVAFIKGAEFAASYLGEAVPAHLLEEAFEEWLVELGQEQ